MRGDTLLFHHDYSGQKIFITDSLGHQFEDKRDQLTDSRFLILKLDSGALELRPLNVSALIICFEATASILSHPPPSQYDLLLSGHTIRRSLYAIRPPILKLKSKSFFYEDLEFHKIQLSTSTQDYHSSVYYDLEISHADSFYAARTIKKYTSKNRRVKVTYYSGRLSKGEIMEINAHLSESGIYKNEDKRNFRISASHSTRFNTSISCKNKSTKTFHGIKDSYSPLLRPLITKLLKKAQTLEYRKHNKKHCFPLSYRKELSKCKK